MEHFIKCSTIKEEDICWRQSKSIIEKNWTLLLDIFLRWALLFLNASYTKNAVKYSWHNHIQHTYIYTLKLSFFDPPTHHSPYLSCASNMHVLYKHTNKPRKQTDTNTCTCTHARIHGRTDAHFSSLERNRNIQKGLGIATDLLKGFNKIHKVPIWCDFRFDWIQFNIDVSVLLQLQHNVLLRYEREIIWKKRSENYCCKLYKEPFNLLHY